MARQKKPVHRVQMTEGKRNIIHQLLEEYDIQSAEDIQDALKDLLGGTIKEMMEAEMDDHLGYEKSERSNNDDYRNGYKHKQVNSRYGSMEIEVPQDRKSTFEPQVVKKRQKDIPCCTPHGLQNSADVHRTSRTSLQFHCNPLGTTFRIQYRSIQTKVNTVPHTTTQELLKKARGVCRGAVALRPLCGFPQLPKAKKPGPLPRK